ncbi:MAG: hypothetical protein ABMA26_15875 [Limisphaerales bacterium]
MSPKAGQMLVDQIVPRLRVLIPHSVSQVGHEDHEELVQDSTVMAARMLNSAELRGKKVTPGNIAYYTVLHARTGRRSYAAGSPDVLHPKNRMRNGEPESFDETVKEDEFGGEPMLLADVFSNEQEDPATKAARKIDWEQFTATLNERCRAVVLALADGGQLKEVARRFRVSTSTINTCRNQLAMKTREFFGSDILKDVVRLPQWKSGLLAQREMLACRVERQPC